MAIFGKKVFDELYVHLSGLDHLDDAEQQQLIVDALRLNVPPLMTTWLVTVTDQLLVPVSRVPPERVNVPVEISAEANVAVPPDLLIWILKKLVEPASIFWLREPVKTTVDAPMLKMVAVRVKSPPTVIEEVPRFQVPELNSVFPPMETKLFCVFNVPLT